MNTDSKKTIGMTLAVLLLLTLIFTCWILPGSAVDESTSGETSNDAYKGPEYCSECHNEEYTEWLEKDHAKAFEKSDFQMAWLETGKANYCLRCHTTGFDPQSGDYVLEGVTCESCHGPYVEGHPATSMTVDNSADLCGTCHRVVHAPTYEEWLVSGHSRNNVECGSCHVSHSLTLRKGNTTALCASCHQEAVDDVHFIRGIKCVTCHMSLTPIDPLARRTGSTGHTFRIIPEVCATCHVMTHTGPGIVRNETQIPSLSESLSSIQPAIRELERRILELEIEVETTGNFYLYLGGGLFVGLILGIGIVYAPRPRRE